MVATCSRHDCSDELKHSNVECFPLQDQIGEDSLYKPEGAVVIEIRRLDR